MIIIKIKTDNDAFQDGNREAEVARILQELSAHIRDLELPIYKNLRDINGNTVGSIQSDHDDDDEISDVLCPQCEGEDDDCLYCKGVGTVSENSANEWHQQND